MVNPKIWGVPMWKSMVNVVKDYPENPSPQDKQQYGMWFSLFAFVLPCEKCRNNFRRHIKHLPIQNYLGSKMELATWLHLVYNETLKDQGRELISFKEFWKKYGNDNPDGNISGMGSGMGGGQMGGGYFGLSTQVWVILIIVLALGYYYRFHRRGTPLASLMK